MTLKLSQSGILPILTTVTLFVLFLKFYFFSLTWKSKLKSRGRQRPRNSFPIFLFVDLNCRNSKALGMLAKLSRLVEENSPADMERGNWKVLRRKTNKSLTQ